MGNPLVIVESPAKAKTIARFLGDDYMVESSVGHVRDLPAKAAEIPARYKKEKWASLGVNVEDHFQPIYVVSPQKKDQVRHLKQLLAEADELYLATDEDREGEAIAWHLLEVLKPKVPVKRMVFHEITKDAIDAAIANPRELDVDRVRAQEARRIYDRLFGYEVSPVLWKKVMRGLSAGRVQSVATRLIVARERERMAFISSDYWSLSGLLALEKNDGSPFPASLHSVDGTRIAGSNSFDDKGNKTNDDLVLTGDSASDLRERVLRATLEVRSVEAKPVTRKPQPPFMTSTLQREAGNKLRFSTSQTMSLAQRLYQNGFITYMRTDSTTLSQTALEAARTEVRERYGAEYVPDSPRIYNKKVEGAQEAHEAIRPAGDRFRSPEEIRQELGTQEAKLYELIWQRTVASQMENARLERVTVRLAATLDDGREAVFNASGQTVLFPGFMKAYADRTDDAEDSSDDERILPAMAEGDRATARELEAKGHTTSPPARYTEPKLVQELEERGIGRPSTYAATISVIQDRGYVRKKGSALVPTFTAFAVIQLLEKHFEKLVDYEATKRMEMGLDRIAGGSAESEPWLADFYFGIADGDEIRPDAAERIAAIDPDGSAHTDLRGLKEMVEDIGDIDARAVNSIDLGADPETGEKIVARVGRYGEYIQRGDDTANIPDGMDPDQLTPQVCVELLAIPKERELGKHPDSGLPIYVKNGRFGPYVQLGEFDDESDEKPKMASLFETMDVATVTLDDAVQLLSFPRVVGVDPADGEEITVQNGKFGPYIKKGTDSRSLENEAQLLTVTLDESLALLAEPKRRRGQTTKPPLRDFGPDPDTERPIKVKEGRFGPYVTDGETNASLRKGDLVEELTFERALELLADRRAQGPSKKKAPAKKKAKKKAPAKKKAAKKKAPAKKKAAAKKKAPATSD